MRVLFDIVHPAHVHFYRHLIGELEADGHSTTVVARDTDVTCALLDAYGITYTTVPGAGRSGLVRLGLELVRRDVALARIARRVGADVILTRNPAGVQAARLAGAHGVFDSDDGRAVGLLFRIAAPFAHVITTPECIGADFGAKHVRYPGYKPLAFLHPDRFTPDATVLDELGVGAGETYAVVRLVAFNSSHDRADAGLAPRVRDELLGRLDGFGRVFITSEAPVPSDLEPYVLPLPAHRLHDALAFAALCVTDGQSTAGEAAMLGVPAIRYSTTAGRLAVLVDLADRYGLITEFAPGDDAAFLDTVEAFAAQPDRPKWQAARAELLETACDVTAWMHEHLTAGRLAPALR